MNDATRLDDAIARAVQALRRQQDADGSWNAPTAAGAEDATRLAAQYVLLNHLLRRPRVDTETALLAPLLARQAADGSWGSVGTSVLVYLALKLAGHASTEPALRTARDAILAGGGLSACDVETRRWIATFGEFPWAGVPTVPVELMLAPAWTVVSIYRLAGLQRAMVVALMMQSAQRWSAHLPPERGLHELWLTPPVATAVAYGSGSGLSVRHVLIAGDRFAKRIGYTPLVGLHRRALAQAIEWLLRHQEHDGAWAGDVRVTISAVMSLHATGFAIDHPVLVRALQAIDAGVIVRDGVTQLAPRRDQLWQTATALRALHGAGVPPSDPTVVAAMARLRQQAVTAAGDWTATAARVPPGGWPAAPAATAYPCVDTTATALAATPAPLRDDPAAVAALAWMTAMQSANGGYAATDVDSRSLSWEQSALADAGPLTAPPSAATTGGVLRALAAQGFDRHVGRPLRAIEFLRRRCDPVRAWDGDVVATGTALSGLAAIGESVASQPFTAAVTWLREAQRADGSWAGSADADAAVSTAVAVEALVAIDGAAGTAPRHGADWLLAAQRPDGGWDARTRRNGTWFDLAGTTAALAALGAYRQGLAA